MNATVDGIRGPGEMVHIPGPTQVVRKHDDTESSTQKRKRDLRKPAQNSAPKGEQAPADEAEKEEETERSGGMDCFV